MELETALMTVQTGQWIGAVAVVVMFALAALRRFIKIPAAWLPLASVLSATAVSLAGSTVSDATTGEAAAAGATAGVAASGLWSLAGKQIVERLPAIIAAFKRDAPQ